MSGDWLVKIWWTVDWLLLLRFDMLFSSALFGVLVLLDLVETFLPCSCSSIKDCSIWLFFGVLATALLLGDSFTLTWIDCWFRFNGVLISTISWLTVVWCELSFCWSAWSSLSITWSSLSVMTGCLAVFVLFLIFFLASVVFSDLFFAPEIPVAALFLPYAFNSWKKI